MATYRCRDCKNFRGKWGVSGCSKGCSADPRVGTSYFDGYQTVMAGCVMFERLQPARMTEEKKITAA